VAEYQCIVDNIERAENLEDHYNNKKDQKNYFLATHLKASTRVIQQEHIQEILGSTSSYFNSNLQGN
jgi:hypothetical protein